MADIATGTATFVMPYYGDHSDSLDYLEQAVAGICEQTDDSWHLVIVDDCSPSTLSSDCLADFDKLLGGRLTILRTVHNTGPGTCRNRAIRWAASHGSPLVLFNDADDISHPRRLELSREVLASADDVDFVYSTFIVIDENGKTVPTRSLTPSISEILDSHATAPVNGPDAWVRIGTETGYATLTSTVAVTTELAVRQPFAEVRGSEDAHTWYRMSAAGRGFRYVPAIPSLYRVPQGVVGSSDRSRLGTEYYSLKAEHDIAGFAQAIEIARERGTLSPGIASEVMAKFLYRLSLTMRLERQDAVADQLIEQAKDIIGGQASG